MSVLKERAAALGGSVTQAVKVNSLGKWKTALQMGAMGGMLLLRRADTMLGSAPDVLAAVHWGARVSLLGLWAGAFLAVRGPVASFFRQLPGVAHRTNACHSCGSARTYPRVWQLIHSTEGHLARMGGVPCDLGIPGFLVTRAQGCCGS